MLTQYLDERTMLFPDRVDGWRDAIEQVAAPLLADGAITREYVDAMLTSIANGGTYIDLGYGIALAHARPESGVVRTGLSALWVRPAVLLNDEEAHPIRLFVCLAAADSSAHLAALAQLGQLLTDEAARDALLAATDPTTALAVLTAGEQS
ncbi:PTS sugar transporter subunit IIA [Cellulomonas triticagri]|uniref:Ascorbate-specific PTS system EIIA component n=1 Tax=Cellulomonas triticagri TaxID=2483352 RepID=A0A3M2JBB8_9CELL|nr:PTS sugar transporter subunit IIA [Cellulomonas triticagri]RMI09516.1 PTS sugar transporter subunit IIA [Cellulomonas triticagri]